jgi:hypothetical protein
VGAIVAGAAATAAWLLLFGLLATSTSGYVWLTLGASVAAWLCALGLMRFGDRGAATGIAMTTALGMGIAVVLVVQRWVTAGWPLW